MKILAIGDLHGQKPVIHFKEFDCIIQVGDLCSDKEFRPYIKKWFAYLKNNENTISLQKFLEKNVGKSRLKTFEKNSLLVGRKILEYFNSFRKPVFIVPGNWDQSYGKTKIKDLDKNYYSLARAFSDFWLGDHINPRLTKSLENIYDCQYKLRKFLGVNFIGYGLSSNNEDRNKKGDKLSKKELAILDKLFIRMFGKLSSEYNRSKNLPTILISHNVPYNTRLDVIKNRDNHSNKRHLGSSIARKFCEKYSPLLCICGHIHEGIGKDKIGKTIVINPGFGKDAQVLIDIDEKMGKVKKVEFYK